MIFRQYQLSCLSLFSYLVGDETTGRAVVVDPQRDVTGYLDDATELGLTIERVIETHFHADFVSGHLELAARTGATISYSDVAAAEFEFEGLPHGRRLSLGDVALEIRHTPGHTPESMSIIVFEHATDPQPWGVLTGDTLFVGDVGRPDLMASVGWTADDLARQLYRSVHDELLTLPDDTRVFPAHGAGSACGKSLSSAVSSTIGEQRRTNYALAPMTEDDFVAAVTEGQTVAPLYFAFAAGANRRDHSLLDEEEPPTVLHADDLFDSETLDDRVILDARSNETFASGHLRGSVNVGLDGRFAEYAGDVIHAGRPIVLVTDPGREVEARVRLGRIGFDTVTGAVPDVEAVLDARPDLAATAARVPAAEVVEWLADGSDLQLVDVRSTGEISEGLVQGATNVPIAGLLDGLTDLDPDQPTVVYCAGGYRSSTAASLLRSRGFASVADVLGGFPALLAAGAPVAPAHPPR